MIKTFPSMLHYIRIGKLSKTTYPAPTSVNHWSPSTEDFEAAAITTPKNALESVESWNIQLHPPPEELVLDETPLSSALEDPATSLNHSQQVRLSNL